MIGEILGGLALGGLMDRWERRGLLSRLARLQRDGILLGTVRATEGGLGRFGDMPLSSEWHVSPGLVRVGSTRIVVASVDPGSRTVGAGEFLLPPTLTAVALTVRGPGPTVEIVMAAESEEWFRAAVAAG